jgi:hypothetical protein
VATQISAPIRILSLLGLIAATAIGAYTFTSGPAATSGGSAAPSVLRPVQEAKSVAAKLNAHNLSTATGNPAAATPAAPTARATPAKKQAAGPAAAAPTTKPAATPATAKPRATKPAQPKVAPGATATIAALLRNHQVVVVLLYNPESKVDTYSFAEAVLGAREANAGFISVSVLDQRAASPFTKAYGVLQDPSVLFFGRPGRLAQKLTGFADHATIAQAATNVALARAGS